MIAAAGAARRRALRHAGVLLLWLLLETIAGAAAAALDDGGEKTTVMARAMLMMRKTRELATSCSSCFVIMSGKDAMDMPMDMDLIVLGNDCKDGIGMDRIMPGKDEIDMDLSMLRTEAAIDMNRRRELMIIMIRSVLRWLLRRHIMP
nr:unnamed protein product [Digitaria exilis]